MGPTVSQEKRYKELDAIRETRYSKVIQIKDSYQDFKIKQDVVLQIKQQFQNDIKKQAKHAKELKHPALKEIQEYYIYQPEFRSYKQLHMIMTPVEGKFLFRYFKKLSTVDVINIYHQCKDVLQYLHSQKIVGTQLKSMTVMISKDLKIKLYEYGITHEKLEHYVLDIDIEKPDYYKSPELIFQTQKTEKSDLWVLGLLTLELAVGKFVRQIYTSYAGLDAKGFRNYIIENLDLNYEILKYILPLLELNPDKRIYYQEIDVRNTQSTNEDIRKLFKENPDPRELNCSNTLVDDNLAEILVKQGKFLFNLDVSGNDITDLFLRKIQPILMNLYSLKLAFTDVTDEGVIFALQKMKRLTRIDLSYTRITERSLNLLRSLQKLKYLTIWSGSEYLERYYDYIVLNYARNYMRYNYNTIIITDESIKVIQNIAGMREVTLHARSKQLDDLVHVMDDSMFCLESQGSFNKTSLSKIFSAKFLGRLYLRNTKIKEQHEIVSKTLYSVCLIDCRFSSIQNLLSTFQNFESIKALTLSNSNLDDGAIILLVKNLPTIRRLNLSNNLIGKSGAESIAKNLHRLKSLDLNNNNIGNDGMLEISNNLPYLISLNANYNNLYGNVGMINFGVKNQNLVSIDLWNNKIMLEGAIQLSKSAKNVKFLFLGSNKIGTKAVSFICAGLPGLITLDLRNNEIQKEGAIQITQKLSKLQILNLGINKIGDEGAAILALKLENLKVLNLDNNQISKKGAHQLSRNLKNILSLSLDDNLVKDQGAIQISRNLTDIQVLYLKNNQITKIGALELVKNLTKITRLHLSRNNIDEKSKQKIQTISKYVEL